jgi:hypothetical protein
MTSSLLVFPQPDRREYLLVVELELRFVLDP